MTNRSDTEGSDASQFKRFMDQLNGARSVFLADNDGEVQLRRTLGNHLYVNGSCPQHSECARGHSRHPFDSLAYECDYRDVRYCCDAVDAAAFDLRFEFAAQGLHGAFTILFADHERN